MKFLTDMKKLDTNNITDTDTNNTYVVTVRATDIAGNTSDQTLTTTEFQALSYIASNPDLIGPLGSASDEHLAFHYVNFGHGEGRSATSFNSDRYLASNTDLIGPLRKGAEYISNHNASDISKRLIFSRHLAYDVVCNSLM